MYGPREDSLLLLKNLKKYTRKEDIVLDIGTGSGILTREAAKYASKVIASDIDKKVINDLKEKNENRNIEFIHSDLFSNIKKRFDLIVFNPPYLPSKGIKHRDIDGGKQGTEVIQKFLKEAKGHLKDKGKILILISSLNKDIGNLFSRYKYKSRKISEQRFFFEKLLVYELK